MKLSWESIYRVSSLSFLPGFNVLNKPPPPTPLTHDLRHDFNFTELNRFRQSDQPMFSSHPLYDTRLLKGRIIN